MYSAQLLDYFQNPRNAGDVTDADAVVEVENPACGDILRLSMKVENGCVAEIRFKARGCVPAMACGSALTEMVVGRSVREVQAITREELIERVGGLPQASGHAAHLAIEALSQLLVKVR